MIMIKKKVIKRILCVTMKNDVGWRLKQKM